MDSRDEPMSAEQTAIEVERLRKKLATPKPEERRRVESTKNAMRIMRANKK